MAKTHNPVLDPRFREFITNFLLDFVNEARDKMLLCPVTVLRKYLSRTEQLHPACASLFVLMTKRKNQVS